MNQKKVKSTHPKKQVQPKNNTVKAKPSLPTIPDKLKEEESEKRTRITLDLDAETYAQLKRLVEYNLI